MTHAPRPRGRPRRGSEAATVRLTIRLTPTAATQLQAEADAAGERVRTTAQRGLLAWLSERLTTNASPAPSGQED